MPNHWVSQGMDGRWVHRIEGKNRPVGTFQTQQEAWDAAKRAAKADRAEAFLQGETGHIRVRNTYNRSFREF